jgi:hypothetical protein
MTDAAAPSMINMVAVCTSYLLDLLAEFSFIVRKVSFSGKKKPDLPGGRSG